MDEDESNDNRMMNPLPPFPIKRTDECLMKVSKLFVQPMDGSFSANPPFNSFFLFFRDIVVVVVGFVGSKLDDGIVYIMWHT